MIALDTNILVYAAIDAYTKHAAANRALERLRAGWASWAVPWPCVHEFFGVVTNGKLFDPPMPIEAVLASLQNLVDDPHVRLIGEGPHHVSVLGRLVRAANITGAKIHDARIAAICISHGVDELWTADRDFSYFPELKTRNPLIG